MARWRGCLERHLVRDPAGEAAARLAAGAPPGDVLLAHDGGADRTTTVDALADLLASLASGAWPSPPSAPSRPAELSIPRWRCVTTT